MKRKKEGKRMMHPSIRVCLSRNGSSFGLLIIRKCDRFYWIALSIIAMLELK